MADSIEVRDDRKHPFFIVQRDVMARHGAALGPYGAMDTGGFVTAFTLAATALGVATIPQAAVAAFAPMIRAHFGIPDTRLVLCAISFGYADTEHPANSFRTTRADLSDILDLRG